MLDLILKVSRGVSIKSKVSETILTIFKALTKKELYCKKIKRKNKTQNSVLSSLC